MDGLDAARGIVYGVLIMALVYLLLYLVWG